MEKYKSKIDLWLVLFLAVTLGGSAIKMLYDGIWNGFFILLFTIAFVVQMFVTTYYIIDQEKLIIKSGFLVSLSIDINTIKKIEETNNILSSPALSLDRIEIFYNMSDNIMISPKDKAKFVAAIQKINPQVEIKKKR